MGRSVVRSDMVILLPEDDGRYTTYVTVTKLMEAVAVTSSTAYDWIQAKAVRCHEVRGQKYAALCDAIKLKLTPSRETLASGVYRRPEDKRRRSSKEYAIRQESTCPAEHSHEVWDDHDLVQLCELYEAGVNQTEIALKLGRTYAAVGVRLDILRTNGDLPVIYHDTDWIEQALGLLTHREYEELGQLVREV